MTQLNSASEAPELMHRMIKNIIIVDKTFSQFRSIFDHSDLSIRDGEGRYNH